MVTGACSAPPKEATQITMSGGRNRGSRQRKSRSSRCAVAVAPTDAASARSASMLCAASSTAGQRSSLAYALRASLHYNEGIVAEVPCKF